MIQKWIFWLYFILFVWFTWPSEEKDVDVNIREHVKLEENLQLLTRIDRAAFFNDSLYAISSNADGLLYLYNNGRQISQIGNKGKGPYEYESPRAVHIYRDLFYVWDQENLKFLVFNKKAEPVDELTEFGRQVKDFCVSDDFIAISQSNGVIRIIDKEDESVIYESDEPDIDDRVLLFMDSNGRIACNNDSVIYGYPSRLEMFSYHIPDERLESKKIEDEKFIVHSTGWESVSEVNQNINEVNEYLFSNSSFNGFYSLDDFVVGVADIGKFDPDDLSPSFNLNYSFSEEEKRRKHFYVFDEDLNYLDRIVFTPDSHDRIGNQILGVNGNSLYFLKEDLDAEATNVVRTLYEVEFVRD